MSFGFGDINYDLNNMLGLNTFNDASMSGAFTISGGEVLTFGERVKKIEEIAIPAEKNLFWTFIREVIREYPHWKELELAGIGVFKREILKLLGEAGDLSPYREELIYFSAFSLEELEKVAGAKMNTLHMAAFCSHYDCAELALNLSDNLHFTAQESGERKTALCYAAESRSCAIMNLLLVHGADPCHKSLKDFNLLAIAVSGAHVILVKRLAAYATASQVEEALKLAINSHHEVHSHKNRKSYDKIICFLIDLIFDTEFSENFPLSALHQAASKGELEISQYLVERGVPVDYLHGNLTPLMYAINNTGLSVFKFLVGQGADINKSCALFTPIELTAKLGLFGMTRVLIGNERLDVRSGCQKPLHQAVKRNRLHIVDLLLEKFPINEENQKGKTPLDLAIAQNNKKMIKKLKSCGGIEGNKIEEVNYNNCRSLPLELLSLFTTETSLKNHLVAEIKSGNEDGVALSLKNGHSPHYVSQNGRTLLHYASSKNLVKTIQLLVQNGLVIGLKDKKKMNCLHYAARSGSFNAIVDILKLKPSLLNCMDALGNTAIHYAAYRGCYKSVALMLSRGAKLFANKEGMTPAHLAFYNHKIEIFNLLSSHKSTSALEIEQFILRRGLMHLIFPTKPTLLPKEKNMLVDKYGGNTDYFFNEIAGSLIEFSSQFPFAMSYEKAIVLSKCYLNATHNAINEGDDIPIVISTGFKNHSVVILIWKNLFCVCNKGMLSENNVDVYRFNRNRLSQEDLNKMNQLTSKKPSNFKKFIYRILKKKLGFVREEFESDLMKVFRKFLPQSNPTCAWTSVQTSMKACFILEATQGERNIKQGTREGLNKFSIWNAFMKINALEKYLNFALNRQYSVDKLLIKTSLAFLRTKKLHPLLEKKVKELDDLWANFTLWEVPQSHIVTKNKEKYLWRGSQYLCSQMIPLEKVINFYEQLKVKQNEGAVFNVGKIDVNLTGGVCTAMSLHFVKLYVKAKKSLIAQAFQKDYQRCVLSLRSEFRKAAQHMRVAQVVFNTIELKSSTFVLDPSLAKAKLLLSSCGFQTSSASKEMYYSPGNFSDLNNYLKDLETGIYLIRDIMPFSNKKAEYCGHSLIYVKEINCTFIYDPNKGVIESSQLHDHLVIPSILKNLFDSYNLEYYRFYKIEYD